ncbi:MAG: hypothetical protein ACREYF_26545 [Gammaproteobacteria bacterium]
MHALKIISGVVTFAALSLSGSAVWAQSFKAKADLDSLNLVPPILSQRGGTITLTFKKPTPATTGTGFAAARVRSRPPPTNPAVIETTDPGNLQAFEVKNIRLYFGQRFADGHPIATLCDNDIDPALGFKCPIIQSDPTASPRMVKFALSDFQFEGFQLQRDIDDTDSQVDENRRVPEDKNGLRLIKELIKRGLIYVVVNSEFKAKVGEDEFGTPPITTIVGYKPPKCSLLPSFYCKKPNGDIIIDGVIRGTLHLVPK